VGRLLQQKNGSNDHILFRIRDASNLEVEVTLRLTVSQSVCLGIEHPCGTSNHILLPVGMLLSEICDFVSMGRPL
jgi:hypothetical protein